MSTSRFIFLGFIVGAVADVVLRDAVDMAELRPYFAEHSALGGMFLAGVTVAVVLAITAALVLPRRRGKYLAACFAVSWVADVWFEWQEPLGPSLRPYYARRDARLWGALAGPVAAGVVYGIEDFLLPAICSEEKRK